MTINIADNTPRKSYTVTAGNTSTSFDTEFEFFAEADLNVYVDGTKKTLSADYTVSGGNGSTGTVAMSVTGASGNSTVVLTRSIALERTTDFPSQGAFQITSLNTELDRITAIQADLNDETQRSIRLADDDTDLSMILPLKDSRVNKVLSFDSAGALTTSQTIGTSKGSDATVTTAAYVKHDLIKSTTTAQLNNVFICIADSVVGDSLTDTDHFLLVVDAVAAAASATAAANSATNATTTATNAVADTTKIASNAEDSQFTLSDSSTTGFSALHYKEKAEAAKTIAQNMSGTAATQAGNALSSATAANNARDAAVAARDATFVALDSFDDRYLGSMADSQSQAIVNTTGTWVTNIEYPSQLTVADATGIVVGMLVTSASGVQAETNVISISGTTIGVNQFFSQTVTDQAVTFTGHGVLGDFNSTKDGPATDNDNNALVGGQLYYNTTDAAIRIYNGSVWVAAYSSGANFLPLAGGQLTGNLTFSGSETVDGRDVSVDGTKLDAIEAAADVTDATNVTAAGAAMLTGATFTGAVVAPSVAVDNININGQTISTTDNLHLFLSPNGTGDIIAEVDTFTIKNTSDGILGPNLVLDHTSASPSTTDTNAIFSILANDAGGTEFSPVQMTYQTPDVTSGTPTGKAIIKVKEDGTSSPTTYVTFDGDAEQVTFAKRVVMQATTDLEAVNELVGILTSTSGTVSVNTALKAIMFCTANQTADRTVNFTSVNNTLDIGQSVTCAVLLTLGSTGYSLNAYQVDGSSVTPKWQGGTAPSGGNANSIDVYSFTIIKTADATFTVLASQTQFA